MGTGCRQLVYWYHSIYMYEPYICNFLFDSIQYIIRCVCVCVCMCVCSLQHDIVEGVPMEHLLSALLDALADPTVSYIGLGYDATIGISTGKCGHCFVWFLENGMQSLYWCWFYSIP